MGTVNIGGENTINLSVKYALTARCILFFACELAQENKKITKKEILQQARQSLFDFGFSHRFENHKIEFDSEKFPPIFFKCKKLFPYVFEDVIESDFLEFD